MSESPWRVRVTYHLPSDDTPNQDGDSLAEAYLEVLGQFQTNPEIEGYTETTGAGFWRSPQDEIYLSEVRVVAVDYKEQDEAELNAHIKRIKMMIDKIYTYHGWRQLVIYVTSQDLMLH